jgi:N-acetylneuraminate synthase
MNKVYFIADIASNHDGNLSRAKNLCLLAKQSGANAVKFQHFQASTIVSDKGFKDLGSNLSHQTSWEKSIYETYQDVSVPLDWTPILKEYCDSINIDFFTTPYDLNYVDYLDQYVSMYKIGSGDITWTQLLNKVAQKNKPILLATGASNMSDVVRAMDILLSYNIPITLMQCNTNYTVNNENFKYINLNVLKTYSSMYPNITLGLSDHTLGCETVLGAIALGATFIEKHFTDDNTRKGPDHKFSMNPNTWKQMVNSARLLENALGGSIKRIEHNEIETSILQRRSIWVNKDLKKGHVITEDDIYYVRPCPKDAFPIHTNPVGKVLLCNKGKNNYIQRHDIK